MKDKLIDTVTLTGKGDENVEVKSILLADDGGLLRALNLLQPLFMKGMKETQKP